MRRTVLLTLAAAGAAAGLGLVLGSVVHDDDTGPPRGSRPAAAATPVDPATDPSADPAWPARSPLEPLEPLGGPPTPGEAGLLAAAYEIAFDPESGIDADEPPDRGPFIPPTSPASGADAAGDGAGAGAPVATGDPPSPGDVDDAERPGRGSDVPDADDLGPDSGDEPVPIPVLDDLDEGFRFLDPCASEGADPDECPDGVGGSILLSLEAEPPEPLTIGRVWYTTPLDGADCSLGADAGGAAGRFATTNPGQFTIRYWPTEHPERARRVEFESTDLERQRWAERRASGEPPSVHPIHWVQNCPVLEGVDVREQITLQIDGIDDFGSTASVELTGYVAPGEGRAAPARRPSGRPLASVTPVSEMLAWITVPYDPSTEEVYVAVLPRTGPRATTQACTDVEHAVLTRRHRSDVALVDAESRPAVWARAPGDDVGDVGDLERFSHVVVTTMVQEEGSTALVCTWTARPPVRSFDVPSATSRDSFVVRAPRRLRTRISVAGGHASQPLEPRSIRVHPTNWPSGWSGTFPPEPVRATAFMLDEPQLLVDSGSQRVPGTTLLEVTGPAGTSVELAVPTPTDCPLAGIACAGPSTKLYDVSIPGPRAGSGLCGSSFGQPCEPPTTETFVGNLRLLVETYPGPGGAPSGDPAEDKWRVVADGMFPPAPASGLAEEPQIDHTASYLRHASPVRGQRPGLELRLDFDRPMQVTVQPRGLFMEGCDGEAQTFDDFRARVFAQWRDLCWGGDYMVDLLAVDEDGRTIDLRQWIDGELSGRPGWGHASLRHLPVAEYRAAVTIDRVGDGLGVRSASLTVGRGTTPVIADGSARCAADGSRRELGPIRNDAGRAIQWPELVPVRLLVAGGGDHLGRCGDPGEHTRLQVDALVPITELLAGPVTITSDTPDGAVTIELYEVAPGEPGLVP